MIFLRKMIAHIVRLMRKQADIPAEKAINGQEVLMSWRPQTACKFLESKTRLMTEKLLE